MTSFWGEIRRRKVFQVAVAYAIVGWLLAQVAATTFPILLLPDWILRAFVIIILLGFPLALVLAWAFQTTSEGIKRDHGQASSESGPETERGTSGIALVVAGTLTVGLVLGGFIGRSSVQAPQNVETAKTPVQLTANPENNPVIASAISPDGRYLAYVEASGLYLRVIETGEFHQLSLPDDMSFARSEIDWFPDGTHLLLAAQIGLESSLWKLAIVGGAPRKLIDGAVSAAISPDGTQIAFFNVYLEGTVNLMGSEGEDPRELVSNDTLAIREMAWSPNNKFLLIGASVAPDLRDTQMHAVNVSSGESHEVMDDPRTFQNWRGHLPFYWAPDGRLLFARAEPRPSQRMSNLWQVDLDSENAIIAGNPSQVTRLTGYNFRDLTLTATGNRAAFLLEKNQADIYLADVADDGRHVSRTRRFTFDERDDYMAGWSADGQEIYFQSDRGAVTNIFAKPVDGGPVRAIGAGANSDEDNVEQSPDGKWVLYWGPNEDLLRTPTTGGPSELVLQGTLMSDFSCPTNSEAGTDCVVSIREPDNQYVFYAFSPEYGLGKKLLAVEDEPPFANWSMSPDGKTVALAHNKKAIRTINLETGDEREFAEDGWVFGEYVDWSADGQAVFMDGTANNRLFKKSLIYYSPETRDAIVIRDEASQWHVAPAASPDGTKLAFSLMIFSGNAWMIENP